MTAVPNKSQAQSAAISTLQIQIVNDLNLTLTSKVNVSFLASSGVSTLKAPFVAKGWTCTVVVEPQPWLGNPNQPAPNTTYLVVA